MNRRNAKVRAYERVVAALAKSKNYVNQKELAELARTTQPVVSRTLAKLRTQDSILENRNQFPVTYKLKDSLALALREAEKMAEEKEEGVQALTSDQLYAFLDLWSRETWNPKAVKSLRNLPHAIASLYGLAVEASYGADVNKGDIQKVQALVNETRQDLLKAVEVIDRLLKTDDVMDPDELAVFLLANRDPEKIQRLTHRVREIN